jgi:hypothetical protein
MLFTPSSWSGWNFTAGPGRLRAVRVARGDAGAAPSFARSNGDSDYRNAHAVLFREVCGADAFDRAETAFDDATKAPQAFQLMDKDVTALLDRGRTPARGTPASAATPLPATPARAIGYASRPCDPADEVKHVRMYSCLPNFRAVAWRRSGNRNAGRRGRRGGDAATASLRHCARDGSSVAARCARPRSKALRRHRLDDAGRSAAAVEVVRGSTRRAPAKSW